MRNLKIGAKIFVAFGTAIALMLISTGVVFFANTGIIDNVNAISKDSELQTAGNTLKDNFLLSRVAAIRLLSTTDSEVYDSFTKQAEIATQGYSDIYKIIDKNSFLEDFRPAFQRAESEYMAYLAKANELGKANQEEEEQIETMSVAGANLAQYCELIFQDQMELFRNEIAAGNMTKDAQNRRASRVETGADIALHISQFRLYAREMMASFDTSNMPATLEVIDETYAVLEAYNKESSIPQNKEHSQLLMDNIAEYRAALVEFGVACDHAAAAAVELVPLGAAALESLTSAVELLDVAMVEQVQSTTASASSTLIWVMAISLLSVVAAIIMAFIIMRGITVPVSKMVRAADSLALGEVNVDAHYESKDEIGSLSASFEKMLAGIRSQVAVVESLADGDLTVSANPRSDKDAMGHGLQKMLDNLNGMFGEINASTAQVSTGSKQIADGAQSLAQGSTEQAAAVEQLSSSISEIAEKTRSNAEMALRAANLAATIKENAEKGSMQMDQMTDAVKEINQASQSINKVIKVIDDIAFQTNILALNAAVEAARAGQHGKGFAVVAEEVRNLAAKSAEAAKDTGGLIVNSMEKAELGARIADETAASLAEIVSGINQSNQIVGEIAKSSEEQSEGISQVNKGIDMVAQVVQQNSATAEQSAAASADMNVQSDNLEHLVSQFKLKDTGMRNWGLSSAPQAKQKRLAMPENAGHASIDSDYGKY